MKDVYICEHYGIICHYFYNIRINITIIARKYENIEGYFAINESQEYALILLLPVLLCFLTKIVKNC